MASLLVHRIVPDFELAGRGSTAFNQRSHSECSFDDCSNERRRSHVLKSLRPLVPFRFRCRCGIALAVRVDGGELMRQAPLLIDIAVIAEVKVGLV